MNFDRSLIFAYLEEDNIQRAYFRVRPLLTMDGDVRQEALALWPNEGGLRIVPDRNEQHTFKTRMRTLGSYCVVDLRGQPAEAGKIRTNKNFRPDRGEVNQYILYSDTVHELPEHTFYQLVEGKAEDYAALADKAITPLFYIRQDDTLYGPVSKKIPEQPNPAEEAAGILFEIPCPDGVNRCMLCIEPQKAVEVGEPVCEEVIPEQTVAQEEEATNEAEKAEPAAKEELPIGETLHILDQTQKHEETLRQLNKPVSETANLLHQKQPQTEPALTMPKENVLLTGTPLVRTPLHMSVQQPKNRTQEVVSNQWSVGKYESPAQNLPAGAKLRSVENPVEAACGYLRQAWNATSAHEQLVDCILSLDGIQGQLETKLCAGKSGTMMQRVLQQRLQDLEAERLSALCELDRAQRDVDSYKQELLNTMSSRVSKEIGTLEESKSALQNHVNFLKTESNALMLQRDALLSKVNELQKEHIPEAVAKLLADYQMAAPMSGTPLRMHPVSGQNVKLDVLIDRLMQVCATADISIDRNCAIVLLVLLAVSPRIGVSCATMASASTLMKNVACSLGWGDSYAQQYAAEQQPLVGMRPVDSTPAVLTTSLPNYTVRDGITKIMINRHVNGMVRNAAYDVSQWPIIMLPPIAYVDEMEQLGEPVSEASIKTIAEKAFVTDKELDAVLMPVLKATAPLSGAARKEMYRFVSVCAGLLEGGLPVAVDWAILLWVVPALEHGSKQYHVVKELLNEYPLSLAKL